jgi:hypothetical protein
MTQERNLYAVYKFTTPAKTAYIGKVMAGDVDAWPSNGRGKLPNGYMGSGTEWNEHGVKQWEAGEILWEILAKCPTEELALAHERHCIVVAERNHEFLFNINHATPRSEAAVLLRIKEREEMVKKAEEANRLAKEEALRLLDLSPYERNQELEARRLAAEKAEEEEQHRAEQASGSSRRTDSATDRFVKNVAGSVGRQVGSVLFRQLGTALVRGVLGGLLRR